MLPRMNCSVKFFEPIVIVPLLPAPETGLMRLPAYLPVPEDELDPDELPPELDEPESELPQPTANRLMAAATAPAAILRGRVTLLRGSLRGWTDGGRRIDPNGCCAARCAPRGGSRRARAPRTGRRARASA